MNTILDIPKVKEKYDYAKDIIKSVLSDAVFAGEMEKLHTALTELKKNNKIYDYKLELVIPNKKLIVLLKPIRCAEVIEVTYVI